VIRGPQGIPEKRVIPVIPVIQVLSDQEDLLEIRVRTEILDIRAPRVSGGLKERSDLPVKRVPRAH